MSCSESFHLLEELTSNYKVTKTDCINHLLNKLRVLDYLTCYNIVNSFYSNKGW